MSNTSNNNAPWQKQERILFANLPDELYRPRFLVDTGSNTIRREEEISPKAGGRRPQWSPNLMNE